MIDGVVVALDSHMNRGILGVMRIFLFFILVGVLVILFRFSTRVSWIEKSAQGSTGDVPPIVGCFDSCFGVKAKNSCEPNSFGFEKCTGQCFGAYYNNCRGIEGSVKKQFLGQ